MFIHDWRDPSDQVHDLWQFVVACPMNNGVLMQYTGLKDNNGREVYEGDVMQFDLDSEFQNSAVYFSNGSFCVGTMSEERLYDELKYWGPKIKVIGNIYEHPELIQ